MKKKLKTAKNSQYPSIFITGASSGIGCALAIAYAAPNVHLFLCGRNETRLKQTVKACEDKGAIVHSYIFDVTDSAVVQSSIQNANAICPLTLVIANAGVSSGILGLRENANATQTILQTNIGGVVNTVLPAIQVFKENGGGQLALMSSMAGNRGLPSCPAYSASKACVRAWGEALRGFLREDNIKVNVICPGFIKTPLTDANAFGMPFLMQPDRAAAIIKKGIAKNRGIIAFPLPMAFAGWLLRFLPNFILDFILNRLPRKEI